jgi:hypothetical protein
MAGATVLFAALNSAAPPWAATVQIESELLNYSKSFTKNTIIKKTQATSFCNFNSAESTSPLVSWARG